MVSFLIGFFLTVETILPNSDLGVNLFFSLGAIFFAPSGMVLQLDGGAFVPIFSLGDLGNEDFRNEQGGEVHSVGVISIFPG